MLTLSRLCLNRCFIFRLCLLSQGSLLLGTLLEIPSSCWPTKPARTPLSSAIGVGGWVAKSITSSKALCSVAPPSRCYMLPSLSTNSDSRSLPERAPQKLSELNHQVGPDLPKTLMASPFSETPPKKHQKINETVLNLPVIMRYRFKCMRCTLFLRHENFFLLPRCACFSLPSSSYLFSSKIL